MPGEDVAGRIAVRRGNGLVPLLPAEDARSLVAQPWKGILVESHHVQRGEIPEHEHPELCLHLQISGRENFEWWSSGKNAIEKTQPGALILIPPGTRDRLLWNGSSQRIILSAGLGSLSQLAQELGGREPLEFKGNWSLVDSALANVMTEMNREAKAGWPLGSLYADLLSVGLQTRLLKNYATFPIPDRPIKGGLSTLKLRRAMEYITSNLSEDISLDNVARELELSPSHFAHEFRNSTGQTPYQYLLDQRMQKAKALLKETKWPIQYISALAGFTSPVNFVRAFRQRVGQTPAVWRQDLD